MTAKELPMRGLADARLANHAASGLPAWLWSIDGARILWANPVGAHLFGAGRPADLSTTSFGPADPHRRQVAELAGRLAPDGGVRLERLRGFGAALGRLVTCGCSRIRLADGVEAILIVAVEAIGRPMPLGERLQRLVEDADIPLAAFGRDGVFVGASPAARSLLGFRDLAEAGLGKARDDALKSGRTETPIGLGHLVLQRVGNGADVGLIALLEPKAVAAPQTVPLGDFDAPFALFDEMSDFDDAPPDKISTFEPDESWEQETPHDVSTDDIRPNPEQRLEEVSPPRAQPLRFLWDIDSQDRFSVNSPELLALVGPNAAATLDAPWQDVASAYTSYGRMAAAISSHAAWAGISLALPADGADELLIAELSGIPSYQNDAFAGYRGFGVVHDLETLTRIERIRSGRTAHTPLPQSLSAQTSHAAAMDAFDHSDHDADHHDHFCEETLPNVGTPPNVVPLRVSAEGWAPALTPVENNAFNELARELSARLEADHAADSGFSRMTAPSEELQAAGSSATDAGMRALLDLAPAAMAVHRAGRLLYANHAFVAMLGHSDLAEVLGRAFDPSTIGHARTQTLTWDGETAAALIVEASQPTKADTEKPEAVVEQGAASAEDLGAILDAADDAILMFDSQGIIRACNRSAAKLFGVAGDALVAHDLASLFTSDTQVAITPLLERLRESSQEQTVDARTIVGGKELPLRLTVGARGPEGTNLYALVRDLSPEQAGKAELAQARRQSERASADKADILARVSHEMRSPLSAIIGFADVMIEQRFGPLGNDRYAEYLRDIRGCGERVVAIVDDLLDLSRIESGKRDLAPTSLNLNDLVEQCVAAMQPQANRERIIIRSSLTHQLPQVVADSAALRQIALNLIGNSIHLANPGGQVIVSTVHTDSGDVLLRVRDTGHGLNDNEVANALAPFRPSDDPDAPAQIRLSLTRALAEANQARFTVKPAPYAGTLIEVAFAGAQARR